MYNAVIKKSILCLMVSGTLLGFTACNGNNKTQSEADILLEKAQKEYESNNLTGSTIFLDSLKTTFPDEIETQRKAIHLRTLIIEKATKKEIISNDSTMQIADAEVESLKSNFNYIKTKDMVEGYRVHKKAPALLNRTGIEARIDENDEIYLVSLVHGLALNHTRISISAPSGEMLSNDVPYNGTTNYRFKDSATPNEMITFRGLKCDTLCMFITDNKDANVKLNFIGKSRHSIPLNASDRKIISETQRYSAALKASKKAHDMELYYKNKLKITQEQIQKTKVD